MGSHARKPILSVQPVGGGITTTSGSGTFTTPGDVVSINSIGMSTAIVQFGVGGGFNGFLAHFEGSIDGTNFYVIPGYRLVSGTVVQTTPAFTVPLPTRTYFVNVAGYSTFRVFLDALISGSPTALIVATEASVDPRAMDVASDASLQALLAWYDGTNGPIHVDFAGATQPVSVADGADVAQGTTTDAAVTSDTNGTVIGFLRGLVKMVASAWDSVNGRLKVDGSGVTQPVQRLNDAGRNTRIFMLDAITAAPVAEALASVVQWYGNAAVAGTTTPAVVPAGKTLRLTGYKIQYQSLATVGYAVVRIRCNTGGVAALASPMVASFEAGTNSGSVTTAVTGAVTMETGSFPEGVELPAGSGIGFSIAGYGPTGTLTLEGGVRFEVHGYEY